MKDIDRYRGCLLGGAAGDALGYAVEFLEDWQIFEKYGENGITRYALSRGKALISDDTQMTLFTANGLLLSATCRMLGDWAPDEMEAIHACYLDWLRTQHAAQHSDTRGEVSWLNNVPEMNDRRAPGGTCLGALKSDAVGTVTQPVNDSKGCGGVMRVAPVGLYWDESLGDTDEMDMLGAQAAALTHGHELGYLPAAMLVHMVHQLAHGKAASVREAVKDAMDAMKRLFPQAAHLEELLVLIRRAIALADQAEGDDLEAIRQLGEGWVGEETLAIAVYCALRYAHDFEQAIIAAVNHSGDSDSTGAVTGNILGAYLGMKGIPEHFLENLELKETVLEMADDLFYGCLPPRADGRLDAIWEQKYILRNYPHA